MKITLAASILALVTVACAATKAAPSAAPSAAATATVATSSVSDAERVWSVRDNGKRCIVAPCPSWTATDAASGEQVEIAKVDLVALKLAPKDEADVRAKILRGEMKARGAMVVVPKMGPGGDGKVLRVSAVVVP